MRLRAVLLAVLVACALAIPAAYAAPALSCANPTVLTSYQGTLSYPPYVVQQDVWSPRNGTSQTMSVCSEHEWTAVVNQAGVAADGVATYPDSQKTDTDWSSSCAPQPALSTFSKMKGTYSQTSPSSGSFDWTWDIFLNNYCGKPLIEVMVLNQWRAIDFPASTSVTIGKVAYLYYHSGSLIQFRRVNQNTSGTLNLLRILRWCERHGLVMPTDTRQFVAYGVEVLTTGGVDLAFPLTGFSITDAH